MLERGYSGIRAHSRSRLARATSTPTLAGRPDARAATANCPHPSTYMPTKIPPEGGGQPIDTLENGVEATRRLVVDPGLDGVTGRFFDRTREARAHELAYNLPTTLAPARRCGSAALWQRSLELVGADPPA